MGIKENRNIAFSKEAKDNGRWEKLGGVDLEPGKTAICYFPGLDFPVNLTI